MIQINKFIKKEIKNIIDHYRLNCSIDEFENKVDWHLIGVNQQLSELFIEKFKDYVFWHFISKYQKLSEKFIEKYSNYIYWPYISEYQKLSESFIEKYENKVNWNYICIYQQLSEPFIEKHKDKVYWYLISKYQNLSPSFRKKYNLEIPENNTNYMTKKEISDLIPDCYKRKGDYVIAYKNIKIDRYSQFNFQYMYEKGGIYESHCDCNNDHENSFGLSLWTYNQARNFHRRGIVVKCRVKIEDIGAVVHKENKLRCKRIEVLE